MARRTKKRKKSGCAVPLILCVGLILLVAVWILSRLHPTGPQPWDARRNSDLIPRNTYSMDGFVAANGRISYEDETTYTVAGIDVSLYQGDVDWNLVAQDGISFAMIQAGHRGYTDGELGEDEQYRANLDGAKAAGLDVGVYFFSQAVSVAEAREEANYLLDLLGDTELDLPVFYDWERVEEERTQDVTGETVTECARVFCEIVEAAGYEAGVYFNQDYAYNLVDLSQLLDYPLWFAQYQNLPDFIYDFTWWQYTEEGTVAGINHPVDLNIWFLEK